MKALKLTPKQREVFQDLQSYPGGVLRQHIKPTGTLCFRLMDIKRNPIKNYRVGLIEELVSKQVIELSKAPGFTEYVLKADTDDNAAKYRNIGLVKDAV